MALPSTHLKSLTRRRPLPPQLTLTRATMADLDDCFYVVHSAQGYADDVRDLRRLLTLFLSHPSSHLLVLGRVEDTPVSLVVLYSPRPSRKALASPSSLLTKPKDILLKHIWTHGAWQRRGYAPASLLHAFSLIPTFLEDQMQPETHVSIEQRSKESQASKRHSYPFAATVRRPGSDRAPGLTRGSSRPWVVWAEVWQSHVASLCLELGFLHFGERTVWRCWKSSEPRIAEAGTMPISNSTSTSTSPPPSSPTAVSIERHKRGASHSSIQGPVVSTGNDTTVPAGATFPSPTASPFSS
ncbi:hypothetical protein BJ684DRAFT_21597 [Piptocephalis cylindrospora]|uniref:Uncharacterized protein n=1 Tax=Piptocephalis cylindrospora TaxID=1907219 RepID=A0A4P9XZB9_9FUNG|nr:hypothetical protein BJ684DRAFT_21597 [Piptocephalis cylindrospora]|eukprot:RKP11828.1 hypothetical protein BJ684DRAFT_21597 [Piptocephalis cylindrospora]